MHASPDWYRSFFSGLVVEGWLGAMPPEHTAREVEFIRSQLDVAPPARLLDVPCGGGRHSILLATAGFQMTSVDLSTDFLHAARNANPNIDWQQRDMTDLPWTGEFDGAFCFGNSFGYLSDAENQCFLNAVAKTLKPGARFVLDYPVCLESLASCWMPTSSGQLGGMQWDRNGIYDPRSGRIFVEHRITKGEQTECKVMSQRAYTCRQVWERLASAGFSDVQIFSGIRGETFTLGSKGFIAAAQAAA